MHRNIVDDIDFDYRERRLLGGKLKQTSIGSKIHS